MKKDCKIFLFASGVLFLFLILQIASLQSPKYYLNLSPSEPPGLYKLIPFEGELKAGELVILEVPEQARPYVYGRGWLPKGWLLIKKAGALPGDKVVITADSIIINDFYAGPIFETDTEGKPLPRLRGNIHISGKHFLPLATNIWNSFDGRYFGPVSYDLIRGKAAPVITF